MSDYLAYLGLGALGGGFLLSLIIYYIGRFPEYKHKTSRFVFKWITFAIFEIGVILLFVMLIVDASGEGWYYYLILYLMVVPVTSIGVGIYIKKTK